MAPSENARTVTRLIEPGDAGRLAELVVRNRGFTARWDPERAEGFYSAAGQEQMIDRLLAAHRAGDSLPQVILDEEEVVGQITLLEVVRGAQQSGSVGYWVDQDRNGRGLASAALASVRRAAFGEWGLHRLAAETMVDNRASQRVLERNGFVRIGLAPGFLLVAGRWRDHVLYQALNADWAPR